MIIAPLREREQDPGTASFSYEALTHADVVVVDVQCDYSARRPWTTWCKGSGGDGGPWKTASRSSPSMGPGLSAMVLIETTVPPGTTEYVAYPIMKKAFKASGASRVRAIVGPQLRAGHARQAST